MNKNKDLPFLNGRQRKKVLKGFGFISDPFESAIKRYGVWPLTVWDLDYSDKTMQTLKAEIGDGCQLRAGSGTLGYQSKGHGINSRKGAALKGHIYKQAFEETERRKSARKVDGAGGFNSALRNEKTKDEYYWEYGFRKKKSARKDCFTKEVDDESVYRGKITESIFNPVVAINILNLYAPKTGVCYDPFAGGGTRAIVAAKFGLDYVGVELRQEEVDAIRDRCRYNEVQVEIICASSVSVPQIETGSADFLITCPPYWNLEQYKGGKEDMSMAETYEAFLGMLSDSIKESYRILKKGSLSCWVVGLHRDRKGELLPLNHDVAWLHREAGFKLKEEVVLNMKNTGAVRRVGNFEKGNKFLIRTHEYCLIFEKEV